MHCALHVAAGPEVCFPIGGFTVEAGVDHAGDDLGQAGSVAEALATCLTDSRCKGFNSWGGRKSAVAPTYPQYTCLYTRSAYFSSERGLCVCLCVRCRACA